MSGTAVRDPRARAWVLGPAVLLVAVLVAVLVAWLQGRSDAKPPYRDPGAVGSIGLCDANGAPVTSGSIKAAPFVWRAVGSTAAPQRYAGVGRTATLYAFQPRPGVEPTLWSGRMLTAAGAYSNPAHPMAAATHADIALQDFLTAYPPTDAGYIQLRLYLSAPNQPLQITSYDALDLKVSGDTWHAIGGTSADCSSGTSVSFETENGIGD